MQFPDNYFDDEVRDGFLVPGLMKRAWAAQLEVLFEIDKVCKKHGIKWFADCGTLIGAVRHGGFVPWDDDLDICMLREDYDRFNEIAEAELPDGYRVFSAARSKDFENMLTRVVSRDNIEFGREHLEKYHEFPYISGIDVFALDYVAADEEAESARKDMIKMLVGLLDCVNDENQNSLEVQENIEKAEELCRVKFNRNESIRMQYFMVMDKLFSIFRDDEAEEVALMSYWVQNDNHIYKKEYFKDTVMLPFENTYIQAPAMYDAVLKTEYGDYMRIVQSGGVHDYPYFLKFENMVANAGNGRCPYKYYFNKEDVERRTEDCAGDNYKWKQQLANILLSLSEIHGNIAGLMNNGNAPMALELLVQCQNVAINIGNSIEQRYGQGNKVVKSLEKYCDEIYNIYITIDEAGDAGEMLGRVTSAFEVVRKDFRRHIADRKEIVFIPYKADMWDSIDGLWRECRADETCDVYVVPIPYYYRSVGGDILKECYERKKFPSYVETTFYEDYNFKLRHPDVIYTQYPYDQYNPVFSLHPFAYSENMKNFTDSLVFVQSQIVDEIEPEHEKALLNISQYICNPAVMRADKVIVQSERMKCVLVDALTKFSGEEYRDVWDEKLDGCGLTRLEELRTVKKESVMESLPDEWKERIYREDGSRKKLIIYNNSISAILENKERIIDKIRYVMGVFRANLADVVMVWRHNPLIKPTLEKGYTQLWKEYSGIVEQYKCSDWGIYDDVTSVEDALAVYDAYYGDADSIVQKCRRDGMPVMIEDVGNIS